MNFSPSPNGIKFASYDMETAWIFWNFSDHWQIKNRNIILNN